MAAQEFQTTQGSPGTTQVSPVSPLPVSQASVGAGGSFVTTSFQNPLPTANISPESQASLSFVNGQPFCLLAEDFGSGTINTSTRWNRPLTGGGGNATAATNTVGATTLGTGTVANGFSILQTQRTIWDRNPGYNFFQTNINIPIPSVINSYMLFGFVQVPFTAGLPTPTPAIPCQNGAAFEFGTNGKLAAVTYASQGRQLVADLSVAQTNTPVQQATAGCWTGGCGTTPQIIVPKSGLLITDSYKYVIVFRGDNILWYIEGPNGNLLLVAYTTRGAVGLDINQVPVSFLVMANTPTAPSVTATMQINQVTIGDTAKNLEPGFDRSAYPPQALTAVNDAIGMSTMGAGSCAFTTVSNTNVTLVFEATDANGTNWTAVTAYPWAGGSGIQTVPSGTNGQWVVPCAGFNQVRMRVSAIGATPTVLATAAASVATPTPAPPVVITGNASGTTGAVVGTLAAAAGKTTYISGFNVCSIGGTAPSSPITVAGLVGSSMVYQTPINATGGQVLVSQAFTPAIPASGVSVAITVTTTAAAGAAAVNVNAWGFQQ